VVLRVAFRKPERKRNFFRTRSRAHSKLPLGCIQSSTRALSHLSALTDGAYHLTIEPYPLFCRSGRDSQTCLAGQVRVLLRTQSRCVASSGGLRFGAAVPVDTGESAQRETDLVRRAGEGDDHGVQVSLPPFETHGLMMKDN
jgi:hypothetical protein